MDVIAGLLLIWTVGEGKLITIAAETFTCLNMILYYEFEEVFVLTVQANQFA